MRVFILFLAVLVVACRADEDNKLVIDCLAMQESELDAQIDKLPASFCVEHLEFDTDIQVNRDQVCATIGIAAGMRCTPNLLKMACFYLKRWGMFESSVLSLSSSQGNLWQIHLTLVGRWRLRSISFEGVLFGKDQIKHMYGLPLGQPFDERKHQEALEYIKNSYRQQGYLNATVSARIHRSRVDKYVDVALCVRKGHMYRVGSLSVSVPLGSDVDGAMLDQGLAKRAGHAKYTTEFINAQGAWIKRQLAKCGYPFAGVTLNETRVGYVPRVNGRFAIVLGSRQVCTFFGNRFFSRQQLLDRLTRGRSALWNLSGPLCVQELRELYKRYGFLDSVITLDEQPATWAFAICEGERAHIVDVCVKGLTTLSQRALTKIVRPLIKRQYYDEELLEKVKQSLVCFFSDQGYWDVKILKMVPVRIAPGSDDYALHIYVDEGACQNIQRIEIPGYPDLMHQGPFARFNYIKEPLPFKTSYLEAQSRWLRDYFVKLGYRQVRVKPVCEGDGNGLVLKWNITHDHTKIVFGRPILKTNRKIYDLVDREVCFTAGQPWNRRSIEKTFSNLTQLGIFDDVHVYPSGDVDPCGQQPVVIDAQLDQPFEIKTRIGYQQVSRNFIWRKGSTYRIGGSFIYKNPTNNADIFKINGDFTRFQRKADISYSVPWTFGQPIRTLIKAYSNMFDQPIYIGKKNTVYEALQDGGLISFQYKSDCVNTAFNVGGEGVKITDISDRLAQVIDFAPVLVGKRIPYFYGEPYFFYESLNDKLNPSRGFITLLTAKAMIPGDRRAAYFVKCLAEQAIFVPIAPPIVGAVRIRIGHIFTDNFRAVVPPERFYLGGANSIRSYLPDFAPPLGRITGDDGCVCCVPQGGKTMLNLNIELRFPIVGELTGVVFGDAGVLTKPESADPLSKSFSACCEDCDEGVVWDARILGAIGGGLRYHTPIGPLRFDIGWKPYRLCSSESRFAWFLTLGQAF